jgi:hypothetical protein
MRVQCAVTSAYCGYLTYTGRSNHLSLTPAGSRQALSITLKNKQALVLANGTAMERKLPPLWLPT